MERLIGAVVGGVLGGVIGGVLAALAPKRTDGTQPRWARVAVALGIAIGISATRPLVPVVTAYIEEIRPKTPAEEFKFRLERELRRHPEFMTFASKYSDERQLFDASRELGAKGALRLSDSILVDSSEAYGRALLRLPVEVCVRTVTGTSGPEDAEKLFAALGNEDMDLVVASTVVAMTAELRGSPDQIIPAEDQVLDAADALRAAYGEEVDEILQLGFGDGATPEGKCRAIRYIYMRAKSLPERFRGPLLRAVRM
jgi:hypothetical protein